MALSNLTYDVTTNAIIVGGKSTINASELNILYRPHTNLHSALNDFDTIQQKKFLSVLKGKKLNPYFKITSESLFDILNLYKYCAAITNKEKESNLSKICAILLCRANFCINVKCNNGNWYSSNATIYLHNPFLTYNHVLDSRKASMVPFSINCNGVFFTLDDIDTFFDDVHESLFDELKKQFAGQDIATTIELADIIKICTMQSRAILNVNVSLPFMQNAVNFDLFEPKSSGKIEKPLTTHSNIRKNYAWW